MPKYTYQVRDEQGKTFTGSYTTDNQDRLRAALQNKGYLVLEITETTGGLFTSRTGTTRRKGGKVPGHMLAFFAEQLSTLIAGGVPLVRAIAPTGQSHAPAAPPRQSRWKAARQRRPACAPVLSPLYDGLFPSGR